MTRNSRNVRAMVISHETNENGMNHALALIMANPPSVNTSNSMWPANMFAKSRTASENGRTRKVEKNSIGISSGRMNHGAGGMSDTFTYLTMPWCRMPTQMNMTYLTTASIAGKAMCEVGEICTIGTMPQ